ncbi:MAG: hypothetical protein OXG03_07225 [Gammaproteobacteria bacterium]|nr:hypothetical protein [Gammaproteobacteria bacterium]
MADTRIQFHVHVPVRIKTDEVGYISHCPSLDVFSQGATEEEAINNLLEALKMFLASCYARGTLDEVLRECGFELCEESEPIEDGHILDVPLSLVAHEQAHAA